MQYLEEQSEVGVNTVVARVPIVPAAILLISPSAALHSSDAQGHLSSLQNASNEPAQQGNVGAGTGANVGKILGMGQA
jgi:L-aminopeptidase/D-esterase-like protein